MYFLDTTTATNFWETLDFWIFLAFAIAGLIFSILSFKQAKEAAKQATKAKEAAESATQTVKLQTITIDLTEITQKLDKLSTTIDFSDARDLINETSRKVRRLISPLKNDTEYKETITAIYAYLEQSSDALKQVRPTGEEVVQFAVYNSIENHLAKLNGFLADLLGLIEKRTINLV